MKLQELERMKKDLQRTHKRHEKLMQEIQAIEDNTLSSISEQVDLVKSNLNVDELKTFFKKPYIINRKGEATYEIIVPKFVDFQVGILDRQVHNYNIFLVDKYTKWMTGIPEFLKDEVDIKEGNTFTIDDNQLSYDEGKAPEDKKIREHLTTIKDTKAIIKKGHEFELLAELIGQGELPFIPRSVEKNDTREAKVNFELRSYQKEGYEHFMKHGSACFCWATGAGKSFPTMLALDTIRYSEDFKKAIVVYGKSTAHQWKEYFEEYAPRLLEEVEIVTYASLHKLEGKYGIIAYDECHALPANTFAKGATIPTKYRLGLSASPYREDGRTNFIYALTGKPIGMDWKATLEIMGKKHHAVNIHICKDETEKISRIKKILQENPDKKTLVFSDSLSLGQQIAEKTKLEFVSGADSDQLQKIRANDQVVVSRIGDHGISIKDLNIVLEADFLYGSRRQEIQRTGRLLHGKGERHDIFFTKNEFQKYQKRLWSLIEKGFKVNFIDKKHNINIPENLKNSVEISIEGEKVQKEPPKIEETTQEHHGDNIDLLQNPRIKAEINHRGEQSRASKENVWRAIITIAQATNGLSRQELQQKMGLGYESVRLCIVALTNTQPAMIEEKNNKLRIRSNVLHEIITAQEQREKVDKLLKEVL